MAFLDQTKATAAFKVLFGRAHTTNANELANEAEAAWVQLAGSQIFGEAIPSVAMNTVLTEFVAAKLTAIATASGKAYQAYYPVGHAKAGQKIANIIPQSYGDTYRPILKKNGIEVAPLSAENWFLVASAGIVVSESDLSLSTTGTLECYIYNGKMVQDRLDNLESSLASNQPGVNYACEDDVVNGDVVAFSGSRKVGKLLINTSKEAVGIASGVQGGIGNKTCLVLADDNEISISAVAGTPGQRVFLQSNGSLGVTMPSTSGYRVWQVGLLSDTTHLHISLKLVKVNA